MCKLLVFSNIFKFLQVQEYVVNSGSECTVPNRDSGIVPDFMEPGIAAVIGAAARMTVSVDKTLSMDARVIHSNRSI